MASHVRMSCPSVSPILGWKPYSNVHVGASMTPSSEMNSCTLIDPIHPPRSATSVSVLASPIAFDLACSRAIVKRNATPPKRLRIYQRDERRREDDRHRPSSFSFGGVDDMVHDCPSYCS